MGQEGKSRRLSEYYIILDLDLIGKIEESIPYIYDVEQGWVFDKKRLLTDRIIGYDASEPDDSPYKIGNMDMMERVCKISREEAEARLHAAGRKERLMAPAYNKIGRPL